jgi:hypothetical protein
VFLGIWRTTLRITPQSRSPQALFQEGPRLIRTNQRPGREQEFDEYLELLGTEYKRKWIFMKLLDRIW